MMFLGEAVTAAFWVGPNGRPNLKPIGENYRKQYTRGLGDVLLEIAKVEDDVRIKTEVSL